MRRLRIASLTIAATLAAAGCGETALGPLPAAAPAVAVVHEPSAPAVEPEPAALPAPGADAKADRDKDGIPDVEDACPDEPGRTSPDPKKSGCPHIVRPREPPDYVEQVGFERGQVVPNERSRRVLEEVARVLLAHPEIKRLSVEGHASSDEPNARRLGGVRAKKVIELLVAAKVDRARLVATSWGAERPLADNATDAGKATNRRVHFTILEKVERGASAGGGR